MVVESLNVDQVTRELSVGSCVLIDLREGEERRQHGTIPGATWIPRGMLEFCADPSTPYHRKELDTARRVVLHCASGGRSALAGATLRAMGFSNLAHLEGGLKAWKEASGPIAPADEQAK